MRPWGCARHLELGRRGDLDRVGLRLRRTAAQALFGGEGFAAVVLAGRGGRAPAIPTATVTLPASLDVRHLNSKFSTSLLHLWVCLPIGGGEFGFAGVSPFLPWPVGIASLSHGQRFANSDVSERGCCIRRRVWVGCDLMGDLGGDLGRFGNPRHCLLRAIRRVPLRPGNSRYGGGEGGAWDCRSGGTVGA